MKGIIYILREKENLNFFVEYLPSIKIIYQTQHIHDKILLKLE